MREFRLEDVSALGVVSGCELFVFRISLKVVEVCGSFNFGGVRFVVEVCLLVTLFFVCEYIDSSAGESGRGWLVL